MLLDNLKPMYLHFNHNGGMHVHTILRRPNQNTFIARTTVPSDVSSVVELLIGKEFVKSVVPSNFYLLIKVVIVFFSIP